MTAISRRERTFGKISESLIKTIKQLQKGQATTVIVVFDDIFSKASEARLNEPAINQMEKLELFRESSLKAQEASIEFLTKHGKDYFTKEKGIEFDASKIKTLENLNALVLPATGEIVKDLAEKPNVLTIIPNQRCELIKPMKTPPSEVKKQEIKARITWGLKLLQIDKIWQEYGFKGKEILVGHLDTGVYEEHPDLKGKVEKWAFFDALSRELTSYPPFDTGTHGTHTAGIIVGGNASGVNIGVAPEAKLASAAVLVGEVTLSQILGGMDWAIKNQVSVLNMSLGLTYYEPAFERFVKRLVDMDIFPCFAIGNEGHGTTRSPGNNINAIGVGAIDSEKKVAHFSGGATLSWYNGITNSYDNDVKPDICAPGVAVLSSVPPLQEEKGELIYHTWHDGTSMAAPHVAGVVALLLQAAKEAKEEITVQSLINLIYKNAVQRGDPGHNNRYGRGIINPLKTLREILKE